MSSYFSSKHSYPELSLLPLIVFFSFKTGSLYVTIMAVLELAL